LEIFVILGLQAKAFAIGGIMRNLIFAALLAVSSGFAKDMTGRFGVGADQTLGGVGGLSLQYQASRLFGIQLIMGMSFTAPAADGAEEVTHFDGAVLGFLHLADFDMASLHVGAGANIGTRSEFDNQLNFKAEIPLRVEFFLSNHLSLHTDVGVVFDFIQAANDPPGPGAPDHESDFIFTFGAADLLGSAGFTFWF
jgi:hypothetical protein